MADLFDVMKRMSEKNDPGLMVVPLDQIIRMNKCKRGCEITIGAPEATMWAIHQGNVKGGLLLIDNACYSEVEKELEAERG